MKDIPVLLVFALANRENGFSCGFSILVNLIRNVSNTGYVHVGVLMPKIDIFIRLFLMIDNRQLHLLSPTIRHRNQVTKTQLHLLSPTIRNRHKRHFFSSKQIPRGHFCALFLFGQL
jgi:hypothetical protein